MAKSGKPSFLPDRFDDVERDLGYVGTHRRQRSSWSVFAPVGIGLGAVVVLILAGIWFVDRSDDYLTLDASEVLTLTVLNGTATQGMAARAVDRLVAIGWPEATATNADSTDIQQSVVAYSEDADKAIALGIAQELDLDADSVVQTTAYPGARVTVVLGADYVDTEST